MKTTLIHHSADFDGLFCREIARKFLPEAELIGWDFGDKPLDIPPEGQIYILDLPVDRVFGDEFSGKATTKYFCNDDMLKRVVWIDHHKTSIESHPENIAGYRIDGVAACRLAWQWFTCEDGFIDKRRDPELLPEKRTFVERGVKEPLAVRLAGEYDIWDKRDPRAEVFQFGLRSRVLTSGWWYDLLSSKSEIYCDTLLEAGQMLQRYQQAQDASIMHRSFMVWFHGLRFLVLNTARCNSLTFASFDGDETGHDALMGFYWTGKAWKVSLYHAKHRTDIDLSEIAVKCGGGGHRGACGFETYSLPFVP